MLRQVTTTHVGRFGGIAVLASVLIGVSGVALAKDRVECERVYTPKFGQPGKDVAWEPTTPAIAAAMLKMAKTTADDRVFDLGAGDGSIVMVAAKQFGATAHGIEYNADLAKLAQCYIEAAGLQSRAKVVQGDIFKSDFSNATVVTLFLYPELNLRLRPTLLDMKPGTRVVSHMHKMGDWKWQDEVEQDGRHAYLWIIPAKANGNWELKSTAGDLLTLQLRQKYQELSGDAITPAGKQRASGSIRGFDVTLDLGTAGKLVGKVDGERLVATLTSGTDKKQYEGIRAK